MKIVKLFSRKVLDNTISYEQVPNKLKNMVAEELYKIDKTLIPKDQQDKITSQLQKEGL